MRVHHFANRELVLEVVWQSPLGAIPMGGIPAVATLDDEFYAGEIVGDELFAVDLLTSQADARRNAARREWRQACPICRRRPVESGRGVCDVCIERVDDERDMARMEYESEMAMEEAAAGLPFGGSE